ncbi:MAG: polyprenyl synthetase family protein [Gammaproteobacteria bacterium]
MSHDTNDENARVIAELGYQAEVAGLQQCIEGWLAAADEDMREMLEWQFLGSSKFFRPMTIFACYRAMHGGAVPLEVMRAAVVLEMFHNVSLIIDDIVDKSPLRRGKETLHERFGELAAFMASGYIVADGYQIVAGDTYCTKLFSELMRRLGVAEVVQWKKRRSPLGVSDWRHIAGEDTGSMFEVCARLGTRNDALQQFGRLLGTLYHGCDDVADVKGLTALGGGGEDDLRDGILTLPAALAIQDNDVRAAFCKAQPTDDELAFMRKAFVAAIPGAEDELDRIAAEARKEAELFSKDPRPLIAMIEYTRQLSGR